MKNKNTYLKILNIIKEEIENDNKKDFINYLKEVNFIMSITTKNLIKINKLNEFKNKHVFESVMRNSIEKKQDSLWTRIKNHWKRNKDTYYDILKYGGLLGGLYFVGTKSGREKLKYGFDAVKNSNFGTSVGSKISGEFKALGQDLGLVHKEDYELIEEYKKFLRTCRENYATLKIFVNDFKKLAGSDSSKVFDYKLDGYIEKFNFIKNICIQVKKVRDSIIERQSAAYNRFSKTQNNFTTNYSNPYGNLEEIFSEVLQDYKLLLSNYHEILSNAVYKNTGSSREINIKKIKPLKSDKI